MSEAKRLAGEKAIDYVEDGMIVGVGTGSTVAYFIDALARIRHRIAGAVSSSEQSTARLRGHGIEVLELNDTGPLPLYVDGADECDPAKCLIKGGGAALTREKIIA
ncbi:MAG TPA: ribose-5-phosphate isomerase A, partial [Luteimonas sp.]|nr:ribose-5-phosphate isomerase A [Luteimonas sp.]